MSKQTDLAAVAREAGTGYVNLAGDTMTGNLAIRGTGAATNTHVLTYNENGGEIMLRNAVDNVDQTLIDASFGDSRFIHARSTGDAIYGLPGVNSGGAVRIKKTGYVDGWVMDSAGRVTMPYQPAFIAFAESNQEPSSESKVLYTGVRFNRGNHYNNSESRFTAPVTGFYQFNYRTWLRNTGGATYIFLRVNGSNVASTRLSIDSSSNNSEFNTLTPTFNINLTAGDYVEFALSGSGTHTSTSYFFSEFSGFLLG